MSIGAVRDGGVIGRVGAAQYAEVPMDFDTVMRNITSPAASRPPGPTSRTYCPTCSTARSTRVGCSTAPSASTKYPTGTGPWPTGGRSRSSSTPEPGPPRRHKLSTRGALGTTTQATVGAAPVSYTHLRAHETPEHLVCRLLL